MAFGHRDSRWSSWVRLLARTLAVAMFVAPLRMSYAAPAPVEARPSKKGTGKLPTDTVGALGERLVPAEIAVLDGAGKVTLPAADGARLFDGRSATALETDGRAVRLRLQLAAPARLEAIGVFGRAEGTLSAFVEGPTGRADVLQGVDLARRADEGRWNRQELAIRAVVEAIVLEWRPARPGAALRELELWGRPTSGASAQRGSATGIAALPDALHSGVPTGAVEARAPEAEQTIALATGPRGGTFTFALDAAPPVESRAFLVYELGGLPHFTAVRRSINGLGARGGFAPVFGAKGGLQVEEIAPSWLRAGKNSVQFLAADDRQPASYRVSAARLVIVPGAGGGPSDASARDWAPLRDGRAATGWQVDPGEEPAHREWTFDAPTQPRALELRLERPGAGKVVVAAGEGGARGAATVTLDDLAAGWHRVPLDKLPPTTRLSVSLTAGRETGAALSELGITGSPMPADAAARLAVTYPLAGECVDHRVHLRGFIDPPDAAAILSVNGAAVKAGGALSAEGAFAVEMTDKQAGAASGKPFSVKVEVAYPHGARVSRAIAFGPCLDRPPPVVAGDGRPRQPQEDLGAPYGAAVKAGEAAHLAFAGVGIDIPAGAVDKDVRVTIRPLPQKHVPRMDSGMTNVTPGAQAFRLGPLGMVFKRPIKVTLPYDKKLVPAGYRDTEVRTFYYDETMQRWEQVGLVDQQGDDRGGQLVASTEHFTDFINATIAMPDHPGTQSSNPTSLKDIKLADPSAGMTLIEPPGPSSTGAAVLKLAIEIPPGRRGMQPTIALAYNSEAGNGPLGMGWEVPASSIQIDTRFGVPRYDGTETYLLDGEMLTPIAAPAGAPGGGQYFGRRVEGRFDWIQRLPGGGSGREYKWVVTDKEGTRFTYGESGEGRLAPMSASGAFDYTRTFRWYLDRVEDTYKNRILYSYLRDTGVDGDPFVQTYLWRIDYTAHESGSPAPPYGIIFGQEARPDVIIDARAGFQVRTRRRINAIAVTSGAQMIRLYALGYQPGDFSKSLLSQVSVKGLGATGADLHKHVFTYHQTPRDPLNPSTPRIFGPPREWTTMKRADETPRPADGLTTTGQISTSATTGINLGVSFNGTLVMADDYNRWTFADLTGDGVPDAFEDTGLANVGSLSRPTPTSLVGMMRPLTIPGVSAPHAHVARNVVNGSVSIFGWVDFGIDIHNVAADDILLTDINGDGLPDRVRFGGEGRLLARLNGGQGFGPEVVWQNFSTAFNQSNPFCNDLIDKIDIVHSQYPQVDSLTKWEAPADGTATLIGGLTKAEAGGDGLKASIYLNDGQTPIWERVIAGGDLSTCVPAPNNGCDSGGLPLNLHTGDRLYLRLNGLVGSRADVVSWNPEVVYNVPQAQKSLREPHGAFIHRFGRTADMRMVGQMALPWVSSSRGRVSISGAMHKETTSDDVELRVVKISPPDSDRTTVFTRTIAASEVFQGIVTVPDVPIEPNDMLSVEVLSDVEIDPLRADWRPAITYTEYCRPHPTTGAAVCGTPRATTGPDGATTYLIDNDPLPELPMPQAIIQGAPSAFHPMFQWAPKTATKSVVMTASGDAVIGGAIQKSAVTTGPVTVVVQGVHRLHYKKVFQGDEVATVPLSLVVPGAAAQEQIFFSVYANADAGAAISWSPTVNGDPAPVNVRHRDPRFSADPSRPGVESVMAGGYHGWFFGNWRGDRPFVESQIALDPAAPAPSYLPVFALRAKADAMFDPPPAPEVAASFFGDLVDAFDEVTGWTGINLEPITGPITDAWNAGTRFAGSVILRGISGFNVLARLAPRAARVLLCDMTGDGSSTDVVRFLRGGNKAVGANVGPLGVSFSAGSSQSLIDLVDLNGDRYPDEVAPVGIRYNDGVKFDPAFSGDLPYGAIRAYRHRNIHGSASAVVGGGGKVMQNMQDGAGNSTGYITSTVGVGLGYGLSGTQQDLVDINGDGLPDHVRQQDDGRMFVRLGLGYGFGAEREWPGAAWAEPILGNQQFEVLMNVVFPGEVGPNMLRVQDNTANTSFTGLNAGVDSFNVNAGMTDNITVVRTLVDLIDVNGDGLPDQVLRKGGAGAMLVKLNLGDRFSAEVQQSRMDPWPSAVNLGQVSFDLFSLGSADALAMNRSLTRGRQAGASIPVPVFGLPLSVSGGGSYGQGVSFESLGFQDIDGDGRTDHVVKTNGDSRVHARLNQIGPANLLKRVDRPLGGSIEIDYKRAGNHVDRAASPKIDMPRNQWVMASVTVHDGRQNYITSTYDYSAFGQAGLDAPASGYHDRVEREDYGYAHVRMVRNAFDANGNVIPGRGDGSRVDYFFANQDFYSKGLLEAEFESDENGMLLRGTTTSHLQAPPLPARTGRFFPGQTVSRVTAFYEKADVTLAAALANVRGTAPKYREEVTFLDQEGDLFSVIDLGDEQSSADDVTYRVTSYLKETGTHITRPLQIDAQMSFAPQTLLRRRTATYDPGRGGLRTLTNVVTGGKIPSSGAVYNGASSTHTFTYDTYGNLRTAEDPSGHKLQYTYDVTTQSHRERADDLSFGYFSTATFDLRFGVPLSTTDIAGNTQSFQYDVYGRLCSVFGPDDQGSAVPTIAMSYSAVPASCPNAPAAGGAFPAYAVTRHKDVQAPNDPINTVTFMDGLRRVIETKKDMEVDAAGSGTTEVGMTVSGQILFDGVGRVISQDQPFFSAAPLAAFVEQPSTMNATTIFYDKLGRTTNVIAPDGLPSGIHTETFYGIVGPGQPDDLGDGKRWLLSAVIDPNGNRRVMYADARGNQIAGREWNTIGTATTLTALTTKYTYDPLDQLKTVTDAKGNVTTSEYDSVGQMVALISPDAGRTEYRYDLAGNLGAKETAVLRAQGRLIRHVYDFGRLRTIDYPTSPDVTYTYGGAAERGDSNGNLAGRVKTVTFEGGSEQRFYDRLGNVNRAVTTLANMAGSNPATIGFTMKYSYDWLGRMQDMTFPNWIDQSLRILPGEGEKVTYLYDRGGNLDRITGFQQTANPQQTSHPRDFTYLSHIGYDAFGQRTVLRSGNEISNRYIYDGATRRLTDIKADTFGTLERQQGRPPTPFHRLHYEYDKIGNIQRVQNQVSVQPWRNAAVFVGPMDVTYTYDRLHQLKSMTSKYRPHVAYGYQSSDTYVYDEIGNMDRKAQSQERLVWDNQNVTPTTNPTQAMAQLDGSRFGHNVTALTHTLAYAYGNGRPHATSTVTETLPGSGASPRAFSYDANGNNTGNTFRGTTRTQLWDEESRLKEVRSGGAMTARFRYDDQGERRKKQTSMGDSWYVNQYYVLQPNNLPTKHIFAGETRLVSKTDAIWMQTPAVSHYHPDHLGTTSYTSAANQDLLQHERYFAFGEPWRPGAEQEETDQGRPDNLRREWLFTSKEWDVDTSLYYFGARYYDPRTGVWQSPDPVLADYMQGGGRVGGVYRPSSLGLYGYSRNNPIVLRDPDGLESGEVALLPLRMELHAANPASNPLPRLAGGEPTPLGGEDVVFFGATALSVLAFFAPGAAAAVASFLAPRPNLIQTVNQLGQPPGVNLPSVPAAAVPVAKQAAAATVDAATRAAPIAGKIEGFTKHGLDQAITRGVKPGQILDAVKKPLQVKEVVTDSLGRQSQRHIGREAEVVLNPQSRKVISVNPTSSTKATRLQGR